MRRTAALLALALSAPTGVAHADWPAEGVQLSSQGCRNNDAAQMFRDGTSDVLVVWRRTSNAMVLSAQRVTAAGAIAPGWPADAVGLNYNWLPHLGALDGGGGLYEIFVTSAGVALERTRGDAIQLPASSPYEWPLGDPAAFVSSSAIVNDGGGGSYGGWEGMMGSWASYWGLSHQLTDGTVDPAWPAEGLQVANWSSSSTTAPGLLRDPLGGVYIAWVANAPRMKHYEADGTLSGGWGVSGRVLASTAPDVTRPIVLAPSGSDHAMAMWYDQLTPRVLLNRIARNGTFDPAWPVGGIVAVGTTSGLSSLGIAPDGQGGVWIWWELGSAPYVEHVRSNGTFATGPVALSPLDAAAQYAGNLYAVPGHGDGLLAGWTDSRASRPGVRLRWLLADGTPDPTLPDTALAATPHYPPDFQGPLRAFGRGLLDDGQGGAYVAWDYRSGPLWELMMMQHLAYPGTLGVPPARAPRAALALRAPAPNPAARSIVVRFALADAEPARLELLDVAGRRVRSLDVATTGAEQVARFEDLGRLPAGLYVVRLAQGGVSRSARVAIVH